MVVRANSVSAELMVEPADAVTTHCAVIVGSVSWLPPGIAVAVLSCV